MAALEGLPADHQSVLAANLRRPGKGPALVLQREGDGARWVGAEPHRHDAVRVAGQNFAAEPHAVGGEGHPRHGLFQVQLPAVIPDLAFRPALRQ